MRPQVQAPSDPTKLDVRPTADRCDWMACTLYTGLHDWLLRKLNSRYGPILPSTGSHQAEGGGDTRQSQCLRHEGSGDTRHSQCRIPLPRLASLTGVLLFASWTRLMSTTAAAADSGQTARNGLLVLEQCLSDLKHCLSLPDHKSDDTATHRVAIVDAPGLSPAGKGTHGLAGFCANVFNEALYESAVAAPHRMGEPP